MEQLCWQWLTPRFIRCQRICMQTVSRPGPRPAPCPAQHPTRPGCGPALSDPYDRISAVSTEVDVTKRSLRVAGLFAGVGGLELGLQQAGLETAMLCEVWTPAK